MATTSRDRYSYADLANLPEGRYEIIGGGLFVSPSPTVIHQTIVLRLGAQLLEYARSHGGWAFVAPLDVKFSEADATQPDVIYVAPDRKEIVQEKLLDGSPSLLVEVLSPSSYETDPVDKLELYAQYGVPEYWIVDTRTLSIDAHADPVDGEYRRHGTSTSGSLRSLTISDLTLTIL